MSERWTIEQAREWYSGVRVLGCNYLPRTAVNALEMWQGESFDPKTIDKELGWARQWGYNSVRIFLHFRVWQADPRGQRERLARFLALAEKHGIRAAIVLFDDCWHFGSPLHLGKQDDPVPGVHNSRWVPSPGVEVSLDPQQWAPVKEYVTDIIGSFGQDARVLLWDIYNEPGNNKMDGKTMPLVEASFKWARAAAPKQPLTSGIWREWSGISSQRLIELSDVVSFHHYGPPKEVEQLAKTLRTHRRPLICTEWLCRTPGHDNTFKELLPIFEKYAISAYQWGLVAGRTQTYLPWSSKPGDPTPKEWHHDVLHPDGKPYRQAEMNLARDYAAKIESELTFRSVPADIIRTSDG